jgi:hypothetical protein
VSGTLGPVPICHLLKHSSNGTDNENNWQVIKHGRCITLTNHYGSISIRTAVLTVVSVVLCQVQWPLTKSSACHSSIQGHHGFRINPETLPSRCPITTLSRTAITPSLYCARWRHFVELQRSMQPSCALQSSGKLKNLYVLTNLFTFLHSALNLIPNCVYIHSLV